MCWGCECIVYHLLLFFVLCSISLTGSVGALLKNMGEKLWNEEVYEKLNPSSFHFSSFQFYKGAKLAPSSFQVLDLLVLYCSFFFFFSPMIGSMFILTFIYLLLFAILMMCLVSVECRESSFLLLDFLKEVHFPWK